VDIDVDAMIESGVETLSGVWNTTKEAGQEYYNDQIKPTVDTAIVQAKEEADALRQEAKNQYNSGLEQINQEIDERTQNHTNQAKNQVNKLKIE
jgi:F0F1-type ATP synthase membrane subunit b/b'